MLKVFVAALFLTLSLFFSCQSNRKPTPDIKSLTGWFYVVDSDEGIRILDKNMLKKVYIDPEPIITEKNFATAHLSEEDLDPENRWILQIQLDDEGTEKIRKATSQSKGKQLAFLISGEPLMIPLVESVIEKGNLNFYLDKKKYSKEQIEEVEKLIKRVSNKVIEKIAGLFLKPQGFHLSSPTPSSFLHS